MGIDGDRWEAIRVDARSIRIPYPRRGLLANGGLDPWQNASEHGPITYQRPWIRVDNRSDGYFDDVIE